MSIGCLFLLACLVAGAAASPQGGVGPANAGPPPKTSELCPLLTANFRRNSSSSVPDAVGNGTQPAHPHSLPGGCHELPSGTSSGVHVLQLSSVCSRIPGAGAGHTLPVGSGAVQIEAYCDMETDGGGWTVVQRRDNIEPREDFSRVWQDYKDGFGSLTGEFWWGLEKLSAMTSGNVTYELRVDLSDWEGNTVYAVYQNVKIAPESDGYRLTGGQYSGTAGDSLFYHFGRKFSTKDMDQDSSRDENCAILRGGGGWFGYCSRANLNGIYYTDPNLGQTVFDGINWTDWKGYQYFLKTVQMKIRRVNA